jgi:hypothetical protein
VALLRGGREVERVDAEREEAREEAREVLELEARGGVGGVCDVQQLALGGDVEQGVDYGVDDPEI